MQRLRRLGVLSVAKHLGALYALIGVLIGFFMVLFGVLLAMTGEGEESVGMFVFGFFAPVLYGVGGFLGGALSAWVYNAVAKWLGGIEVELG